jgi:DNA-binding transcriptional MocR family regulator
MHIYESIAQEFITLIGAGQIRPGDRLPSVRRLAQQRKLSASTVIQALRVLESRGLVEARPQSGYYVKSRIARPLEIESSDIVPTPVEVGIIHRMLEILRANGAPKAVPFGSASPAPELLPITRLGRLYASLARKHAKLLAGFSDGSHSEEAFAKSIVRRSLDCGYTVSPDEIIATNSCTEALKLSLQAVTKPGDTVAVESPTYYVMLQMLEAMGLKALELPTHPETGVSVEALDSATKNGEVAACILISNGNNPLGCIIPDENKKAIARLLSSRKVPLIEDDIYGDICFTVERPRPIYAFDKSGNTILCSSFSKTVSPTLRVGYVAAGKRFADVSLQKALTSGKTNPLTQRVLAELLDSRGFDAHLRTLRRHLGEQVARTRDAVVRYFPAETRITDPMGGFVLWVALPEDVNVMLLHQRAVAAGITFVPGEMFSASGRYTNCMRLACGLPWSERIEDALQRLAKLIPD